MFSIKLTADEEAVSHVSFEDFRRFLSGILVCGELAWARKELTADPRWRSSRRHWACARDKSDHLVGPDFRHASAGGYASLPQGELPRGLSAADDGRTVMELHVFLIPVPIAPTVGACAGDCRRLSSAAPTRLKADLVAEADEMHQVLRTAVALQNTIRTNPPGSAWQVHEKMHISAILSAHKPRCELTPAAKAQHHRAEKSPIPPGAACLPTVSKRAASSPTFSDSTVSSGSQICVADIPGLPGMLIPLVCHQSRREHVLLVGATSRSTTLPQLGPALIHSEVSFDALLTRGGVLRWGAHGSPTSTVESVNMTLNFPRARAHLAAPPTLGAPARLASPAILAVNFEEPGSHVDNPIVLDSAPSSRAPSPLQPVDMHQPLARIHQENQQLQAQLAQERHWSAIADRRIQRDSRIIRTIRKALK
ncbi:hypothetical protein A1Q1_05275 [Trichosporon asahii var. asahii CBS 2479]|uniref:Uncharacterized protein n=1 Tax=Trichosporon asahii var. asahii (strain ATCC 90039 / CBS 2479 / JCM 2466 / KCTC 7840 / NBRC 103889/ NCYC 2677 / UAMH 7654) TaxID=1186058 RepID=J5SKY4_TRIAS|nr:hypothetical protein A1Q1_05275 [Trichosporon asahii var. asahii CBS 2479]EJT46191.1 hypothetical protein A1Q1_05275 [Trichosporon asahii var. asahii CBS 2479]